MLFEQLLNPSFIWALIGVILFAGELVIPGLVIIFFGLGSLSVGILVYYVAVPFSVQLSGFIVLSILYLVFFRNMAKKYFKRSPAAPIDEIGKEFIGKTAVVKEAISASLPGRVELNGTLWDAVSDQSIPIGATVQVLKKANIKLEVKPV